MNGETITLRIPRETGRDAGNNAIIGWDEQTVDDVMVAPTSTQNVLDTVRSHGVQLTWDLYLPASWTFVPLAGGRVVIRGDEYLIVGDPRPWLQSPTPWNLHVQAGKVTS